MMLAAGELVVMAYCGIWKIEKLIENGLEIF